LDYLTLFLAGLQSMEYKLAAEGLGQGDVEDFMVASHEVAKQIFLKELPFCFLGQHVYNSLVMHA